MVVDVLTTEELGGKIRELIELAEKFAEPYRQKIFAVLLADYLRSVQKPEAPQQVELPASPVVSQKFVIPIGVRAVLQQYNVPEETIQKLFLVEGPEIQRMLILWGSKESVEGTRNS